MKILVVDDDKVTLYALEVSLTKAGYEVISATNGLEALEKLKSNNFDLIVTDLYMPHMNGNELLKRVKQFNPNIGVIIITAYGEVDSYIESRGLGALEYLNKPIKLAELKRVINCYFNR